MVTLSELFSGRNLTATVQGVKPGLPLRIPAEMLRPTDTIPGHSFEWTEVDGNRDMALVVSQNSPAHRVGQQGGRQRSATMIRSFESQAFTLNQLRNIVLNDNPNMVRDQMGRQFIINQTNWFKKRLMNLRQTAAQVMLFTFKLHFNEKGQLLTSSSGAVTSIEVGIPAGQQGQLDILGDGAIISASWATNTTDIPGQLENIREQMLELAGWEVTEAYYGKNIAKNIANNDYAKEYIKRNESLSSQMFRNANRVPTGFMDYNWHYAGDTFYQDANGDIQKPLGPDEIVFTPSPTDDSWWKHAVGSEIVPTGLGQVGSDAVSMLSQAQEVFGEFAYATIENNPLSIEQFVGINFLPIISATKAVCKADTTP